MGNKRKEILNLPTMIFSIIGAVLVVLGFMLCKNTGFKLEIFSTEGIVTGIQTSTDTDGNIVDKTFSISYSANRGNYTATLHRVDSNLKMGDKVSLYYDFFDPVSVSDKRNGYYGYISLLLGVILLLKNGPRFVRIIRDNYL